MKRFLSLMVAVLAIVGMAQAQDVYTSGYYLDSDGNPTSAVYKNNQLLYSQQLYTTSDDVLCNPATGDVFWIQNGVGSQEWGDIFMNDVQYLNNSYDTHLNGLYWIPEDQNSAQTPEECLLSYGYVYGSDGNKYAAVWKGSSSMPIFLPNYDNGNESEVYDMITIRESDGSVSVYYCGYEYDQMNDETHAVIWKDDDVTGYLYVSEDSYGYAIDYYDNQLYTVVAEWNSYANEWEATVWQSFYDFYGLGVINVSPYSYMAWDIQVVGGAIYVCGHDGVGAKFWVNDSEISYFGGTAYAGMELNTDGTYLLDMNGVVYKNDQAIYAPTECDGLCGLYVEANPCQDANARTLPYFEGFEGGETDWQCMTIIDEDDNWNSEGYCELASYWHRAGIDYPNFAYPYSGDFCAKYSYNDHADQEGWLITPPIYLEANSSNKILSFYSCEKYSSYYDYECVMVSTTGLDPIDFTEVWNPSDDEVSDSWHEVQVDLTAYAGQTIYIAFKYTGNDAHNWYIDDISITESIPTYYITVNSNNASWGDVIGSGVFNEGETCAISATPHSGYSFMAWMKDGEQVSTQPYYTFTVTEDATYTAIFGDNSINYYTITTAANPEDAGMVDGGGIYEENETAYLTATANTGWYFSHWNDGITSNPRSVTVTDNATYTAYFISEVYTITAFAAPEEGGTVSGGGNYHYGDEVVLTATPNSGYMFSSWNDGDTENPRTITVTGNATYSAIFIDASSVIYTIEVVSDNVLLGSVSGGGNYPMGSTIQISAIPATYAYFDSWDDGNTDNPRSVYVDSDMTFTAHFEAYHQYTVTVEAADPTMGAVTGGGTFTEGTTITIRAYPFEGYFFNSWSDGNADNPRNLVVDGDLTLQAIFSENVVNTYTITVMCDANQGNVYGGGNYQEGTRVNLFAIANSGFEFDCWDDGNRDNPRSIVVNGNKTFVAFFKSNGVDESGMMRLVVYPNPATSFIRIEGLEANSEVNIYNAFGMLVKNVAADADVEIGIDELAAGVYVARCGNAVMRFVKM